MASHATIVLLTIPQLPKEAMYNQSWGMWVKKAFKALHILEREGIKELQILEREGI